MQMDTLFLAYGKQVAGGGGGGGSYKLGMFLGFGALKQDLE